MMLIHMLSSTKQFLPNSTHGCLIQYTVFGCLNSNTQIFQFSTLLGAVQLLQYIISNLKYMVLLIITQHDAIYLMGSLILMNDWQSLHSLIIFDNWA